MSKYANPSKSYAWLDGDAFRGLPGAEMPEDVFADELNGFDAYGGVETGFEETSEQQVTKKKVFNYRQSSYKVLRDPLDQGFKMRAVDNSKATLMTRMQGGTVTKKGERYAMEKGIGEEFSILIRLDDGEDQMALWCPRVTLSAPATRAAMDGQNIDGWEFDMTCLEPMIEILPGLPEGMEEAAAAEKKQD